MKNRNNFASIDASDARLASEIIAVMELRRENNQLRAALSARIEDWLQSEQGRAEMRRLLIASGEAQFFQPGH